MAKRLAEKTRQISAVLPPDLYQRLVRQAAKETADQGRTVTPSEVIRAALEEYLDMWETATFVPADAQPPVGTPDPRKGA